MVVLRCSSYVKPQAKSTLICFFFLVEKEVNTVPYVISVSVSLITIANGWIIVLEDKIISKLQERIVAIEGYNSSI